MAIDNEVHDRGDWILVRDLEPDQGRAIRRAAVVLFRFPLGTSDRAIKRVFALGGDQVTIGTDADYDVIVHAGTECGLRFWRREGFVHVAEIEALPMVGG